MFNFFENANTLSSFKWVGSSFQRSIASKDIVCFPYLSLCVVCVNFVQMPIMAGIVTMLMHELRRDSTPRSSRV